MVLNVLEDRGMEFFFKIGQQRSNRAVDDAASIVVVVAAAAIIVVVAAAVAVAFVTFITIQRSRLLDEFQYFTFFTQ